MCGRFALAVDGDDMPYMLETQYFSASASASENSGQTGASDEQHDGEGTSSTNPPDDDVAAGPSQGTSAADQQQSAARSTSLHWNERSREFYHARYNVAPQTYCPVIHREGETDQSFVIESMRWGLIPSWSKKMPEQPLRTINCRDDSLASGSGLWNSAKNHRCIVVAQGFYEWLTKGKEKQPHFVKLADGKLMIMAGLYARAKFDGEDEPLSSFTIITTSSNKQLSFLHDRMPALLTRPEEVKTWLSGDKWSPKLQALVRPYEGELTCYPVLKEVGKVGTENPEYIRPIAERKGNLASFFSKQAASPPKRTGVASNSTELNAKKEEDDTDLPLNPDDDKKVSAKEASSKLAKGEKKREERDDSVEIVEQRPAKKKTKKESSKSPTKSTKGSATLDGFVKSSH